MGLISGSNEFLPAEAQCKVCLYFDTSHPDVRRILLGRDPSGVLLNQARCMCQAPGGRHER